MNAWPLFSGMGWEKGFRGFWFRVKGYGLSVLDHCQHRPIFSERYNGQHGVKKRIYLHLGPWCIRFLRPEARTGEPTP